MRNLKRILTRVLSFAAGCRGDDRLHEEMKSHIAPPTEEFIGAGIS